MSVLLSVLLSVLIVMCVGMNPSLSIAKQVDLQVHIKKPEPDSVVRVSSEASLSSFHFMWLGLAN